MKILLHFTPGTPEGNDSHVAFCSSLWQAHQRKPRGAVWQKRWTDVHHQFLMFYSFWLAFGAPVMWIQRGGNWVFGELCFLARLFWCSSRWMGESHSPLTSTRAEWGHMSQQGPPATVHIARDKITSDATCQWLLWVPAGPVVTRCSRVMAVETRGDRGYWMALGFFPFRITRSLKPHSPHRPRHHIEIEKESNKILKNWVIQKK